MKVKIKTLRNFFKYYVKKKFLNNSFKKYIFYTYYKMENKNILNIYKKLGFVCVSATLSVNEAGKRNYHLKLDGRKLIRL